MQYTLESLFEDHSFRDAAAAAHPPNPTDPDCLSSGVYFRTLDDTTGGVWTQRRSADEAGMYTLGAPSERPLTSGGGRPDFRSGCYPSM